MFKDNYFKSTVLFNSFNSSCFFFSSFFFLSTKISVGFQINEVIR